MSFVVCDNSFVSTPPIKKKVKLSNSPVKPRVKNPKIININSAFIIGENLAEKADKTLVKKASSKSIYSEKIVVDMEQYNIDHIDNIIKKNLTAKISTLPDLEKDLNDALKIIAEEKKGNISGSDKSFVMQQQLIVLRKRIQDVQSTFELGHYIHRTADILESYKKLTTSKTSNSFICTDKKSFVGESIEKNKLIGQYVTIAREYVDIENYKRVQPKLTCPVCGPEFIIKSTTSLEINKESITVERSTLKESIMIRGIDDETLFTCSICGVEVEILDDTPSFKDTDRVNMSSRYTYSRRGHFIDALKKYQGKHNIDPDILGGIISYLKSEMTFHTLTAEKLTKDHLYMFLNEKKLSKHYEDINLLFHIITGKPCPEFSHLESILLEEFEQQEKALDEVVAMDINDVRINSINVYYKLYKLLQRQKYLCKKYDFYILKTKTKEDEHDEILRRAWIILGWNWIDT
jgi:hypothetical protein